MLSTRSGFGNGTCAGFHKFADAAADGHPLFSSRNRFTTRSRPQLGQNGCRDLPNSWARRILAPHAQRCPKNRHTAGTVARRVAEIARKSLRLRLANIDFAEQTLMKNFSIMLKQLGKVNNKSSNTQPRTPWRIPCTKGWDCSVYTRSMSTKIPSTHSTVTIVPIRKHPTFP